MTEISTAVFACVSVAMLAHLATAIVARIRIRRRDDEIDRLRGVIRTLHEQERRSGYYCSRDHSQGRMQSAKTHWHPAARTK